MRFRSTRRLRRIAFAALPALVVAATLFCGLRWYGIGWDGLDPMRRGLALNRRAWESSYRERGLTVPATGPREGYWGSRLGTKKTHPDLGWHEPRTFLPDLLDIDAHGMQRYRVGSGTGARVVVLGGSVAFGSYASAIETTWFHACGAELERRGVPCELIVVAANAWKSEQEVAALRLYGRDLAPDLVVLLDGLNDLTAGATVDALYFQPVATHDGSPWSLLYHARDYPPRVDRYLANVRRAAELTRALGCGLLVVLQPSLADRACRTPVEEELLQNSLAQFGSRDELSRSYAAIRRGLDEASRSGSFDFLDCSRLFDDEPQTVFADLWHFPDVGHRILGLALARRIGPLVERRRLRTSDPASSAKSGGPVDDDPRKKDR